MGPSGVKAAKKKRKESSGWGRATLLDSRMYPNERVFFGLPGGLEVGTLGEPPEKTVCSDHLCHSLCAGCEPSATVRLTGKSVLRHSALSRRGWKWVCWAVVAGVSCTIKQIFFALLGRPERTFYIGSDQNIPALLASDRDVFCAGFELSFSV